MWVCTPTQLCSVSPKHFTLLPGCWGGPELTLGLSLMELAAGTELGVQRQSLEDEERERVQASEEQTELPAPGLCHPQARMEEASVPGCICSFP